ncbi:MAG: ATP-binding protein [Bacteriovoracaceae bacterium]
MKNLIFISVLSKLIVWGGIGTLGWWAYNTQNSQVAEFNEKTQLKKVLQGHIDDYVRTSKVYERSLYSSLRSRDEQRMIKLHSKVQNEFSDLTKQFTSLSSQYGEMMAYTSIIAGVKSIHLSNQERFDYFKKHKSRILRSLQYNYPDTHTKKVNETIDKLNEKKLGTSIKKTKKEMDATFQTLIESSNENAKTRERVFLEKIKYKAMALGIIILIVSLLEYFMMVHPHRKIKKFLEALKDENRGDRLSLGSIKEWREISNLLTEVSLLFFKRSKRLENVLDNINVTVFSLHYDGRIGSQYSKATEKMFHNFRDFETFEDFLNEKVDISHQQIRHSLKSLYSSKDRDDFESHLEQSQFPNSFVIDKGSESERKIIVDYVDKRDPDGNLKEVLVFCRDKTDEIVAKEKLAEDVQRFARIKRASVGINDYFEFIKRTTVLMTEIEVIFDRKQEERVDRLKNDIHELKNNFFMADFMECCEFALEVENIFHESEFESALPKGRIKFRELEQVFKKQHQDLVNLLHLRSNGKYLQVEWSKLDRLQGMIQEGREPEKVLGFIQTFKRYPAQEVFNKYEFYINNLAQECDKEIDFIVTPDSCELTYQEIYSLDNVFGLLITNSIDHGIEEQVVRDSRLKPRHGTIKVTSRRKGEKLEFILKDDGGGIDEEKLAYKAIKAGYWTEEEAKNKSTEEIVQLLFEHALSSKDEASKTSGRGIGMNSIKSKVESLNGEILVHSQKGLGTSFIISFPEGIVLDEHLDYVFAA